MSTSPDGPSAPQASERVSVDAADPDARRERQLAGLSVTIGVVGIAVVATLFLGLVAWL